MSEKSWLTENKVPSVKSLGEDTSGSYSSTWRLSLGKATRDWKQETKQRLRPQEASGDLGRPQVTSGGPAPGQQGASSQPWQEPTGPEELGSPRACAAAQRREAPWPTSGSQS